MIEDEAHPRALAAAGCARFQSLLAHALAALALIIITTARLAHAQVRPNGDWRQIESRHFDIIYEAGLDSIARRAAARAELEHDRLSSGLIRAPAGRIDIILADNSDISNGLATQFPDQRIVIWVRPPVDDLALQYYDDWIELVVAHELTHIFHLDQTGRFGRGLRAAFGRVPTGWPFFPLIGIPRWNIEGLATLVESDHTGVGRVYGSYHEMVVRTAVLENAFPAIDRVSGETPIWPGANRAYIYGSLFMDYVQRRYGDSAHTDLIRKARSSLLPPPWRSDAIAKSALGRSFRDLYDDWRTELESVYAGLADSLRQQGLTQAESLTPAGRWALHPRVSRDGRYLAYAEENGRNLTSTRVIDLANGSDSRVRQNGLGPISWLPADAGYVTAQYQLISPYEIYSDLYLVREHEQRLTRAARAESPDAGPDGRRVVFVQTTAGSNRLVIRDIASGADRVIAEASPDVQWLLPRWSPGGDRIAVQKWTRERGHDVVVIDTAGLELNSVRTNGTDAAPAWSADGRHLLFSSDRTGITNLYAFDLESDQVRQVTNLLGGAFYPEVTPDNRSIYFSGYHADGFHIERIAFDTATWRAVQAAASPAALRGGVAAERQASAPTVNTSQSHNYSPLGSLLPKYWFPQIFGDTALSVFVGAVTAGVDDVGRHSYALQLGYDAEHGRLSGDLRYSYAGLGNPLLALEVVRDWDFTGYVRVTDGEGATIDTLGSYEREDRITLSGSLARRRWRSSAVLTLAVEGVVFNRRVLGPARFVDEHDQLVGVLAGAAFNNARTPALGISPEDGVRGSVYVRRRIEIDPGARDASYSEVLLSGAGYRNVGGQRFAHDVVGVRVSALRRTDLGRGPTDVGGVVDFLPVRGFAKNARIGFTGWTASVEYRMPLALIGRGYRLRPLFIDRVSAGFFADAGNASCDDKQRALYLSCPGVRDKETEALVSAGFEVRANVGIFSFLPSWLRGGIAFPLTGGERNAQIYLTFGPTF